MAGGGSLFAHRLAEDANSPALLLHRGGVVWPAAATEKEAICNLKRWIAHCKWVLTEWYGCRFKYALCPDSSVGERGLKSPCYGSIRPGANSPQQDLRDSFSSSGDALILSVATQIFLPELMEILPTSPAIAGHIPIRNGGVSWAILFIDVKCRAFGYDVAERRMTSSRQPFS